MIDKEEQIIFDIGDKLKRAFPKFKGSVQFNLHPERHEPNINVNQNLMKEKKKENKL